MCVVDIAVVVGVRARVRVCACAFAALAVGGRGRAGDGWVRHRLEYLTAEGMLMGTSGGPQCSGAAQYPRPTAGNVGPGKSLWAPGQLRGQRVVAAPHATLRISPGGPCP